MKNDFSILTGGAELLDRVGPLWNELKKHHAALAPQWADTLSGSFEERRAELIAKGTGGLLVVLALEAGKDIGYSVSTIIASGEGEIDSFYVAERHRQGGVGGVILSRTMKWFEEKSIHAITLDVIAGNDIAQHFYERYGFTVRTTRLRYHPKKARG